MIAFDIAGNIPDGATISSVSLTLRVSRTMVEASTIQLHRLLADWGEGIGVSAGGGGSGAIAAAGDATWVHKFFDTARWATRGGDFSDTISASVSVEGVGSYTWGSTDQMVADVQSWLDDPSSNFGWLLKGDEGVRSAKKFASRETPGAGDRPVLVVEFTP